MLPQAAQVKAVAVCTCDFDDFSDTKGQVERIESIKAGKHRATPPLEWYAGLKKWAYISYPAQ